MSEGTILTTAHLGLGPIGQSILRLTLARSWARVTGAVDVRQEIQGRDIGAVAGVGGVGRSVVRRLGDIGPPRSADIVVQATGSRLRGDVSEQIMEALRWGASVVSTCEELAYPWWHHPGEARAIDSAAREAGRAVLATGINPGFAMDAVALYLSAVVENVDAVHIRRVVDVATRRRPLQAKVGVGVSEDEFSRRRAAGSVGHVGLVESVALLDAALGLGVSTIEETLEPVLAGASLAHDGAAIPAGAVVGIAQRARGLDDGQERIALELEMSLNPPAPGDTIVLAGRPPVSATLEGLQGDLGTAAIVVSALPAVARLEPGLSTMLDLAPLRLRPA